MSDEHDTVNVAEAAVHQPRHNCPDEAVRIRMHSVLCPCHGLVHRVAGDHDSTTSEGSQCGSDGQAWVLPLRPSSSQAMWRCSGVLSVRSVYEPAGE